MLIEVENMAHQMADSDLDTRLEDLHIFENVRTTVYKWVEDNWRDQKYNVILPDEIELRAEIHAQIVAQVLDQSCYS